MNIRVVSSPATAGPIVETSSVSCTPHSDDVHRPRERSRVTARQHPGSRPGRAPDTRGVGPRAAGPTGSARLTQLRAAQHRLRVQPALFQSGVALQGRIGAPLLPCGSLRSERASAGGRAISHVHPPCDGGDLRRDLLQALTPVRRGAVPPQTVPHTLQQAPITGTVTCSACGLLPIVSTDSYSDCPGGQLWWSKFWSPLP